MDWDALHAHGVFNDKSDLQYKFIPAQDDDDRLSDNTSRFYACLHCGMYFFSKFWKPEHRIWWCYLVDFVFFAK